MIFQFRTALSTTVLLFLLSSPLSAELSDPETRDRLKTGLEELLAKRGGVWTEERKQDYIAFVVETFEKAPVVVNSGHADKFLKDLKAIGRFTFTNETDPNPAWFDLEKELVLKRIEGTFLRRLSRSADDTASMEAALDAQIVEWLDWVRQEVLLHHPTIPPEIIEHMLTKRADASLHSRMGNWLEYMGSRVLSPEEMTEMRAWYRKRNDGMKKGATSFINYHYEEYQKEVMRINQTGFTAEERETALAKAEDNLIGSLEFNYVGGILSGSKRLLQPPKSERETELAKTLYDETVKEFDAMVADAADFSEDNTPSAGGGPTTPGSSTNHGPDSHDTGNTPNSAVSTPSDRFPPLDSSLGRPRTETIPSQSDATNHPSTPIPPSDEPSTSPDFARGAALVLLLMAAIAAIVYATRRRT